MDTIKRLYNPVFPDLIRIIKYIESFIRTNKCIIYGGTAVHLALKAKGHKGIYNETDPGWLADLDFYTPSPIGHAVELADYIKSEFKLTEVRVISAAHLTTVRIDVGNNEFVADLSYCPQHVFDKLPFIEYDGFRVVHPWLQFVDYCNMLSFPYDEEPNEVISHRWAKNAERIKLLIDHWPFDEPEPVNWDLLESTRIKDTSDGVDTLLNGTVAFSIYSTLIPEFDARVKPPFNIKSANVEWITTNPPRKETLGPILGYRERCDNPKTVTDSNAFTYCANKLIGFHAITVNKKKFKVVCVPYLLRWLLFNYLYDKDSEYSKLYYSMAITLFEGATKTTNRYLAPSTHVLGRVNHSINYILDLVGLRCRRKNYEFPVCLSRPPNYIAGESMAPKFNYNVSVLYRIGGELIQEYENNALDGLIIN